MSRSISIFLLAAGVLCSGCGKRPQSDSAVATKAAGPGIVFTESAETVECYDFVEVTLTLKQPVAGNPFTGVIVSGGFGEVGKENIPVDGFTISPDGSVYRIRFMPARPGSYSYIVTFQQDNFTQSHAGSFQAVDGKRRGLVRVDPQYPWHFIWEGTGEHYFLNGTTAFFMMGWEDDQVIRDCITRLHGLGINRIRLLLDGRSDRSWTEPIRPGHGFQTNLDPWVAQHPADVRAPGFDYTRFHCAYWQKFERMLRFARDQDVIISVIFGISETDVRPDAGSEDERRFFTQARDWPHSPALRGTWATTWTRTAPCWTHEMGTMLYRLDPYRHLATSHPRRNQHQDRTSTWFSMTSFQQWTRPLHAWMLDQRLQQERTGRIIPQINEEYGYEDHYPDWAPYKAPAASAEGNRRAAWEMVMAGCYQTTGETARRGTGVRPDTGGGWVNGRGDSTMTMLQGYAHMARFFTSLPWWQTDPHDELVDRGYCLAEPGNLYVVYLPNGGDATVKLSAGRYEVKWFNPRTGAYAASSVAAGPAWTSPAAPDKEDWVLLFRRMLSR
jgi:hypothetical protein